MRSMTIEELNEIAGASTASDGVGCVSAVVGIGALLGTAAASAGGLAAVMATVPGAASVLAGVTGMVAGCLALYDDLAPPEWQSAQLWEDFNNVIDTVAYYAVNIVDEVEEVISDHSAGHVTIIYENEIIADFDYDFTNIAPDHT